MRRKKNGIANTPQPDEIQDSKPKDLGTTTGTICWLIGLVGFIALYTSVSHASDVAPDSRWYAWVLVPDTIWQLWTGGRFQFSAIIDRLPVIGIATLVLSLAYCLGGIVRDSVVPDRFSKLESHVIALSIGLNLLSTYTLLMGLAGLLNPIVFSVPLSLAVAVRLWQIQRNRRRTIREQTPTPTAHAPTSINVEETRLTRLVLFCTFLFVVVILLGAMLPPVEFDVREYHLQAPKEWFLQGYISFMPHNIYANMPHGAELHALTAMVFTPGKASWWWGALAGKLIMASFVPLTALGLFAVGSRIGSPFSGAVAALVYVSTPWIAHIAMNGLVECVVGHYLLTSTIVLLVWAQNRKAPRGDESVPPNDYWLLAVAGYLAGGTAACKYTALPLIVAPLIALALLVLWKTNKPQKGISHLLTQQALWTVLVLLAATIAGCGAWYGKNLVLAGNPTYPLLANTIGGSTRTPEKNEQWNVAHQVPADSNGHKYTAASIFESMRDFAWGSRWQSPILFPFALTGIFLFKRQWIIPYILFLIACYLAGWWLLTHRIDRFWVPTIPLLALLAGIGANWTRDRVWMGAVTVVLLLATIILLPLMASGVAVNANFAMLVPLKTQQFDPDELRIHPVHKYMNENVKENYSVMIVGDATPFDISVPVHYNTCFDDCVFDRFLAGKSQKEARQILREHRISHIFFRWSELDRYRSPGNYGYNGRVSRHLVHNRLVVKWNLLKKIEVDGMDDQLGELYQVLGN